MSIDPGLNSYLLEDLPIPIAIIDYVHGTIVRANDELRKLFDLSTEAVEKEQYQAHRIFGTLAWEILGHHLGKGHSLKNYEIPVYTSKGKQVYCLVSLNILPLELHSQAQGQTDLFVICAFQDISQQYDFNNHLYSNFLNESKKYRQIIQTSDLLHQTLDTIAKAHNFDEMLQGVIVKICDTSGWDCAEVWHLPKDKTEMEAHPAWYVAHHHDLPELYLTQFRDESKTLAFPHAVGLAGQVWAQGQPLWIKDVSVEPLFIRHQLAQKYGLKSALAVPIKGERGTVLAVMVFFSFVMMMEDQGIINLITTVGEQLGIAIERKQTELELQASQQKLSSLVNTIPGTFFSANYINHRLVIDYISDGCRALTGYSREDFLTGEIGFGDFIHGDDLGGVAEGRYHQLSHHPTYVVEYRIHTQCGEEKWIWEKGQGLYDDRGQVMAIDGLMMDISDRRRTEEALKQAEANYRGIVENALEGIFQTTPEGAYLSANPALAKIYGYDSPEELIQTLKNIASELYVEPGRRAEFIATLQSQEIVCDFQSEIYRRDRSIIWISENARAVKDQAGNLLYYEGTVEDITERLKLKEQLHLRAFYDNLTGLANRALFMDKLQQALDQVMEKSNSSENQSAYQFGLLFLDLDGFKQVNDNLGHLMGDKLLIAIGERLVSCIRDRDIAARLGGDEFTILLTRITAQEQILQVAERIQLVLSTPFHFGEETIQTGTSIGIYIGNLSNLKQTQNYLNLHPSPHQLAEHNIPAPEDILHRADIALYQAKLSGKGTYHIFQEQHCDEPELLD